MVNNETASTVQNAVRRSTRCPLIVLTGGPGAGKTATLEFIRKMYFDNIGVLPESASIIFSGGFGRGETAALKKAAQRAIYHVQVELERGILEDGKAKIALCDRGTLDGLAYWPDTAESFWAELNTKRESELARYVAVIHLRTPSEFHGYNHQNPIRLEDAHEAALIDERIARVWDGHPNRVFIESRENFFEKVKMALDEIRRQIKNLS